MNDINVSFGAKLNFFDAGKCFSKKQQKQLVSVAKNIGSDSDCFYVGTKKSLHPQSSSNEGLERWNLISLSLVDDKVTDCRVFHDNIERMVTSEIGKPFYSISKRKREKLFNTKLFQYLLEYLKNFDNSKYYSYKVAKQENFAVKTKLEKEVSQFCGQGKINYKELCGSLFSEEKNSFWKLLGN